MLHASGNDPFQDGVDAYRRGDVEGAVGHFKSAIDSGERRQLAHCALGAIYADLGDFVNAQSEFEAALTIDESHIPSRSGLAAVLRERGLVAQADELTNSSRSSTEGIYLNARYLLYAKQRFVEAIVEFDQVIEEWPLYSPAYEARALAQYYAGRHKQAASDLLHLLYAVPGWRENIPPATRSLMETVWGAADAADRINKAARAPVPIGALSESGLLTHRVFYAIRSHLTRPMNAINKESLEDDVAAWHGIHCIFADQSPGTGLAGCWVDRYPPNQGPWLAVIPLALLQFVAMLAQFIYRPIASPALGVSRDEKEAYYNARGYAKSPELNFMLDLQVHHVPYDEGGRAWTEEFESFLASNGQALFNEIIDLEGERSKRDEAIRTFVAQLPVLDEATVEGRKTNERQPGLIMQALNFILLHELAHVTERHSEVKEKFVSTAEDERPFYWCSEIVADRASLQGLLEAAGQRGKINDELLAVAWGVAMVLVTVGVQESLGDETGGHSPPAALRCAMLRDFISLIAPASLFAWDMHILEFMVLAKSVAKACRWNELASALDKCFLSEVAAEDTDFLQQHLERFRQITAECGGRPFSVTVSL